MLKSRQSGHFRSRPQTYRPICYARQSDEGQTVRKGGSATCDLRPTTYLSTDLARDEGTGEGSKQELSCQFGKRHRTPNFSGKKAAILPVVLVANHFSPPGLEPVRSRSRFRSGLGVQPTASGM